MIQPPTEWVPYRCLPRPTRGASPGAPRPDTLCKSALFSVFLLQLRGTVQCDPSASFRVERERCRVARTVVNTAG
jgi:hypothetical protein